MDNFDRQILMALQRNSRISSDELGAEIGLSASACQRRIKKLKQQGVIDSEVAILDPSKLPGFITVIVDVTLAQGGEKVLDDFMRQLASEPQVQQFFYVAGDVDFVVVAITHDMTAYDALSRRLFMANDYVKKFTSKVVIQSQQRSLSLPL